MVFKFYYYYLIFFIIFEKTQLDEAEFTTE